MDYRTCSKCGEIKPETVEFFRKRGTSDRGGLRPDCRECSKARDRAWGKANAEYRSAYRRANRDRNAQANREREIKYMQTDAGREARRKANAKYVASDRGKAVFKLAQHRRRARLAQVRNDFTDDDWLAILAEFDSRCAYCGTGGEMCQEHVVAIANGGPNTASNVVPACRSCNSRKFRTDMGTWYRRQQFFTESRMKTILNHVAADMAA